MNHIYAFILLTYFKDKRAYQCLINILNLHKVDLIYLFGDCFLNHMPIALASTCDDITPFVAKYNFSRLI
jgi:hypothetical protein